MNVYSSEATGDGSSNPNGYSFKSGTSMATPHVVGVVALVLDAAPWLIRNVDGIEALLKASATPISATGCSSSGVPNSFFGFGSVDALAAVQMARTLQQPLVITSISPSNMACQTLPTLTVVGITPSPTSQIGFGLGSCASPVDVSSLASGGSFTLASSLLTPGTYVLCYSTNSGGYV